PPRRWSRRPRTPPVCAASRRHLEVGAGKHGAGGREPVGTEAFHHRFHLLHGERLVGEEAAHAQGGSVVSMADGLAERVNAGARVDGNGSRVVALIAPSRVKPEDMPMLVDTEEEETLLSAVVVVCKRELLAGAQRLTGPRTCETRAAPPGRDAVHQHPR